MDWSGLGVTMVHTHIQHMIDPTTNEAVVIVHANFWCVESKSRRCHLLRRSHPFRIPRSWGENDSFALDATLMRMANDLPSRLKKRYNGWPCTCDDDPGFPCDDDPSDDGFTYEDSLEWANWRYDDVRSKQRGKIYVDPEYGRPKDLPRAPPKDVPDTAPEDGFWIPPIIFPLRVLGGGGGGGGGSGGPGDESAVMSTSGMKSMM